MAAGVNGYAAVGDVTTNVDIDFTNSISGDKVLGENGEMAIQPNVDCPTEINADGRLVLGKGDHTVTIPESEYAGTKDKVTVSFDLGFGKLLRRHVYFSLKDENGEDIASFDFVPYSSELTTDLGVETGDMYYGFNTVLWERKTRFTIELDYANKVITTTTECDFNGRGDVRTNTHEVPMLNTNPLATFTIGSDYDNVARRCEFDNLLIQTTEGNYSSLLENVNIDFSNPITDDKVVGTRGEMTIQPNSTTPTEINAEGRLALGKGENIVAIAEAERAGANDKVTVSFDLGFGKLLRRNVYFNLKDENGENIASFDFIPYSSELTTDLGVETGDMYYGFNTVLWERMTTFTIELDYAKKVITTTTSCAFRGDGNMTTNTHEVPMQNTNPLATFTIGSAYDNMGRRCQFDNLLIITTKAEEVPAFQTVSITGAKGLATFTPSVALDFTDAQDIAAYTATVSGTTVNLTRTNTVAAGEGVLIRSLNGGPVSEDIPVAATAVEPTAGNMFVGVLEEIAQLPTNEVGYTNFILNNNGANGSGFYLANNKTVAAGKAYLRVPTESAGKLSFFSLDGSITAIEGVQAEAAEGEKVYYNLNGQRVANPSKGLYIVGGKKVIVK